MTTQIKEKEKEYLTIRRGINESHVPIDVAVTWLPHSYSIKDIKFIDDKLELLNWINLDFSLHQFSLLFELISEVLCPHILNYNLWKVKLIVVRFHSYDD